MTSESDVCRYVGCEFARHGRRSTRAAHYAAGAIRSNNAENYFSVLKRGVIGTYHHWSECHMHRYLAEFDPRYSTKDKSDTERASDILKGMKPVPSPIGGLTASQTKYFKPPLWIGERRKRWTP